MHTLAKFGQRGKFPKLAKKLLGKQTIQARGLLSRPIFAFDKKATLTWEEDYFSFGDWHIDFSKSQNWPPRPVILKMKNKCFVEILSKTHHWHRAHCGILLIITALVRAASSDKW